MARILYVEDEVDIRAEIAEELEDCGHSVATAANGREGLDLALSFRPEIIICDCLMPVMSGAEMLQQVRAHQAEIGTMPFVFLSAHADQCHKSSGLAAGADAYLTKPIDLDRLVAIVEELVGVGQEA